MYPLKSNGVICVKEVDVGVLVPNVVHVKPLSVEIETVTVLATAFVPPEVLALKVTYLPADDVVKSIAGEIVEELLDNRFKKPA